MVGGGGVGLMAGYCGPTGDFLPAGGGERFALIYFGGFILGGWLCGPPTLALLVEVSLCSSIHISCSLPSLPSLVAVTFTLMHPYKYSALAVAIPLNPVNLSLTSFQF